MDPPSLVSVDVYESGYANYVDHPEDDITASERSEQSSEAPSPLTADGEPSVQQQDRCQRGGYTLLALTGRRFNRRFACQRQHLHNV